MPKRLDGGARRSISSNGCSTTGPSSCCCLVLADLVDYMDSIGLPIEEHTASYLDGCRQAGTVFGSYGSLPCCVVALHQATLAAC